MKYATASPGVRASPPVVASGDLVDYGRTGVKDDDSHAEVVFRIRDVLVRVESSDVDKDHYGKREALTDAYDAAVAAARGIHA